MRSFADGLSLALVTVFIIQPAAADGPEWSLYESESTFKEIEFRETPPLVNTEAYESPITVENGGVYPIISVILDGVEQVPPGQHLPVGSSFSTPARLSTSHTVRVTFGTPATNYYGISFDPLWQRTYDKVQAGTTVRVDDWNVTDGLTPTGGVWTGTYLDVNGNWADSTLVFFANGTFDWYFDSIYVASGTYQQGAVDTYSMRREILVTTDNGNRMTFVFFDYERTLNVEISDGTTRWVPHIQ